MVGREKVFVNRCQKVCRLAPILGYILFRKGIDKVLVADRAYRKYPFQSDESKSRFYATRLVLEMAFDVMVGRTLTHHWEAKCTMPELMLRFFRFQEVTQWKVVVRIE